MQLTIFKRLTAGYLAIMIMVSVFGGYVAFQLNRLNQITHQAAVVDSSVIQATDSLSTRLQILVSLEKKFWSSGDRDFYQLFKKRCSEFTDLLQPLAPMIYAYESDTDINALVAQSNAYVKEVAWLVAQGGAEPDDGYKAERDARINAIDARLRELNVVANRARDERIIKSEAISADVLRVTIALAALTILVGLVISLLTTQRIVRPITRLQQKTRDLAAGNFVTMEAIPAPPEIRHLAEEFNRMSDRLKELDRLKEDFISHVSHNLRTPLTAIWESSKMLIDGTFDSDPENRSQLLTIVRDECRRLILSVDQILDLSRMEGGMMEYRFETVDPGELTRAAVARLSPIARAKRIQLAVIGQDAPPPVRGDPEQLQQLLGNLIGNALKFTDSGGRVTVTVDAPLNAGQGVQIAVADTGCGIEPEHLETIFNKFKRIEEGKNTARGTGLGLPIAKHIIAAHGGKIWVESRKGEGSTFHVSLPSMGPA